MDEIFLSTQVPMRLNSRGIKFIYSDSDLDNFILRTITEWALHDYPCPNAVYNYIWQIIEPPNMRNKIETCRSWKNHLSLIHGIELIVRSMLLGRPAVTFYDVLDTVMSVYPDKRGQIGPLRHFPIIRQVILSNFNPTQETVKINFDDIIISFSEFLDLKIKNCKRPNKESVINTLSEMQFLHFLKEKYHKSNIIELGIKITNFLELRKTLSGYKLDSYHKMSPSKTPNKLLKNEITMAMNNVVAKLKSTKIFPKDSKIKEAIETFATLPFKDAIEKLFRPFLDEQTVIFENHDLDSSRLLDNDPVAVIRKFMDVISESKVYGKLFHLSAIVGAIHETKNGTLKLKQGKEDVDLAPIGERNKIFHQLLCAIGEFLQMYLSHDSNSNPFMDQLDVIMERILDMCKVITIDLEGADLNLTQYKRKCLSNLSECCRSISNCYQDKSSFEDVASVNRLNLDLLSQAQTLLIRLLSEGKLVEEVPKLETINRETVDIVFKSIFNDLCPTDCENGFTLEELVNVRKKTLEVMGLSDWPLTESFLDYVTAIIKSRPKKDNVDESKSNIGPCNCVAVSPEFLMNRISRLPLSVSIDNFTSEVLSSQYGILVTDNTRRIVADSWTEHCNQQSDVMEDGVSTVVDMQAFNLSRFNRPSVMVTDDETIMEVISNVDLLEEVSHATKWNQMYRQHWGDVSQFVQDHVLLAMRFNVRIAETDRGRIRINCMVNETMIRDTSLALQSPDLKSFTNATQRMVGLFVSLVVKTPNLPVSDHIIIQSTADAVTASSERFPVFIDIALSIVSSEFMSDVFLYLLCPVAQILYDSDASSKLQSALSNCCQSTIVVLRQHHPDNPALQHVIQTKALHHNEICIVKEKNEEIPMEIETPQISEEFEIVKQVPIVKVVQKRAQQSPVKLSHISEEGNRSIVEDIRRSEFGVGLEDTAFVTSFNKRMSRLVDHFSSDLYANPTHFVIELIQNADDNQYRSNIRAQLDLAWEYKNDNLILRVTNNECGFSESDLRSLCDIGASTKSCHRPDKIGRKGIGFKSVFLVSDSPEVHSNGFHVRFCRYTINDQQEKVANNALIPQWVSDHNDCYDSQSTTIVLPIVSSLTESIQASVARQLDPSLLLFLRRLRRISVANGPSIEIVDLECTNHKTVVITDQGLKHTWFMYTRPVAIKDQWLQEISPRALSRTDISIAVPFNDHQQSHDMPAFAFLPIRSYGLRFIINADFTIPASREDITNNCPWNKWLIDQAADLFVDTIKLYLSSNSVIATNIAKFIDSIPLPGEVPSDSSFAIIVPKIRSSLSQLSWLPDHSNHLYPPTELIIEYNDDPLLTKILCDRLHMSFLHSSIIDPSNDRRLSVLKWLGCQQLSLTHLSSLLANLSNSELSDCNLVKSIIVAIHTSIHRETNITAVTRIFSLLRTIKLWPVISPDNNVISLDSSPAPVFLPPPHWTNTSDQYPLLRRVICPSFIASFVTSNSTQANPAMGILRRLGVKDLSIKSMIDHALVPCLSRANLTRPVLIQVTQFLVEHCNHQQYKDTVLSKLLFATVNHSPTGIYQTVTASADLSTVHMPLSMDPDNVVSLLQDRVSYIVIDDAYLTDSISRTQWINFFLKVGVSWSFCSTTTNTEIIYPELSQLLSLHDPEINMDILRYLDRNWSSLTNVSTLTILIHTLTSSAWIPVSTSIDTILQSPHNLSLSPITHLPSQVVYLSTNERHMSMISDSLLAYFPFCPVVFQSESLPRQLGMSPQVSQEHILSFLHSAIVDKSISLTKTQCIDLYSWINHNLSKESLRSVFSQLKTSLNDELTILIPSINDSSELIPCGRCYWSLPFDQISIQSPQVYNDLSQVFSDHYNSTTQRPLAKLFPDLKELFVDILQVQEYPLVESIADILHSTLRLLTHDRLLELNNAEVDLIADVYNVIHFLNNYHKQSCRSQINRMYLIPCLSGRYRSYDDYTDKFTIYSWRNIGNVVAFQEVMANDPKPSADFVALNCFTKKENLHQTDNCNQRRLSVSQFLSHYFNLPVLEDHISRQVTNIDEFYQCPDTKSMFDHIEVIISQWIQKNVSRDVASHSLHMLSSLSGFYRSESLVNVNNTLLEPSQIRYNSTHKVYIGPVDKSDSYNIFIGSLDIDNDGAELFDSVMHTLSQWLLDGDSLIYFRDRFKKFYSSLLELIESSDRDQVQIYIRSHNLRIQSSSIEYIYKMFAINQESNMASFADVEKEEVIVGVGEPDSPKTNDVSRKRPRISIENEVMTKKARVDLDMDTVVTSPLAIVKRESSSRPGTPLAVGQIRGSRPGTPLTTVKLDQISLRTMDSAYLSGRLGEQLANDKLRSSRKLGQWDILKMNWLNEHTESLLPYDFKLRATNRSTGLSETIYLEVKATTQPDKRHFHLSAQEVTAAWSNKAQFHLLLVFHGGSMATDTNKVTFAHIPDVLGQLQDSHCKLFIDLAAMLDD